MDARDKLRAYLEREFGDSIYDSDEAAVEIAMVAVDQFIKHECNQEEEDYGEFKYGDRVEMEIKKGDTVKLARKLEVDDESKTDSHFEVTRAMACVPVEEYGEVKEVKGHNPDQIRVLFKSAGDMQWWFHADDLIKVDV